MSETTGVTFQGDLGLSDLFARSQPASLEGPKEPWEFARTVIDHGCFVLLRVSEIRAGRQIRDVVTSALLRRALIISESIRVAAHCGLEEPAGILTRCLIDIQMNLALVTSDQSDTLAKRLAAFHYLTGARHFQKLFDHPDTRGSLQGDPSHFQWSIETIRRLKDYFESDLFDEIREDMKGDKYWHGCKSVGDAFKKAGLTDEYLNLYDVYSPLVHSSNLDFDLAGIDDQGRPRLKALPQRSPSRTNLMLQGMVLKLISILDAFLRDRGNPQYQDPLLASGDDGKPLFETSPVMALMGNLDAVFGEVPLFDEGFPETGGATK